MRRFILLLAMATLIFPGNVAWSQVPAPTRMVVFGDSLCDTGNLFLVTGPNAFPFGGDNPPPLFPIAFYDNGRFCNGPIWTETLAPALGVPTPQPFLLGGTSFAFGGAETGFGLSQRMSPNIGTQISYLGGLPGSLSAEDLVVVWGGANDFNPIPPALLPAPQDMVENMVLHILQLHAVGGRVFLVPNLPPLGDTPQGRAQGPFLQFLLNVSVFEYNLRLKIALDELEDQLGVTIFRFDTFGLVSKLVSEPESVGFSNSAEAAFDLATLTAVPEEQQDDYLFWDTIHPTRAAHRVLGKVATDVVLVQRMKIALDADAEDVIEIKGWLGELQRATLLARLSVADFYLAQGELNSALTVLQRFRGQVIALASRGRLETADSAMLLGDANVAIESLLEILP